MALIAEEAARLSLPRLKNRIVATALKRGPQAITARIPCIHDEAEVLKVLYEGTQEIGGSLVDPFPADTTGFQTNMVCDTPSGSRESVEFYLGWKMMQRFADVHTGHTYDQRFFNKQQTEINKHYQYLFSEWNDMMLNGLGHNKLAMNGVEFYLNYISSNYRPEVEVYGTNDGTPEGTPQPFGLPMVRTLLSQVICGEFDAIITDLATSNAMMTLLEAAGGNTAPMLMAENFGRRVMSDGEYNGTPIIVSDDAGRAKWTTTATIAAASLDTLSVSALNMQWIGFSSLDIGREVTIAGTTFGGAASTTIAAVIDPYTVRLAVPADAAVALGTRVDMPKTNVMYAIRFSEDDGFHFRHPIPNGAAPDAYPCLPAVCGLQELVLGHLQNCPTIHRTAIQLRGQFANESTYSLARLSHYDLLS